jgi:hypothetical protein
MANNGKDLEEASSFVVTAMVVAGWWKTVAYAMDHLQMVAKLFP